MKQQPKTINEAFENVNKALGWKREKDGQLFNPCAACVEKRIATEYGKGER